MTPLFKRAAMLLSVLTFSVAGLRAQVTLTPNAVVAPVGNNTVTLSASADDFNFSGWSAVPSGGISFSDNNWWTSNPTITVSPAAYDYNTAPTPKNVTISKGNQPSATLTIYPSNMWAAYSSTNTHQVRSFNVSNGDLIAGPTTIFSTGQSFAAVGRSPYPNPAEGYFYWIPNSTTNSGSFTLYGVEGDGTNGGSGPVNKNMLTYDMNGGGGDNLGFVRLAVDQGDGVSVANAWILASNSPSANPPNAIYVAKVPVEGTTVSGTVELFTVTLVGGTAENFLNGDLCLDGSGKMYVLANGGGTTEIWTGTPNDVANTLTLTKVWTVVKPGGAAFDVNVNGVCFDEAGSLYLSASDGIYYIDQATVDGATGQVQATKTTLLANNYTDLGTNVYPNTSLPVVFGPVQGSYSGSGIEISWETSSEKNNDYFGIELSTDGVEFKEVGRVDSKAISGRSDTPLTYQFNLGLQDVQQLAVPVLLLLLLLLPIAFKHVNRRFRLPALLGMLMVSAMIISCTKSDLQKVDTENTSVYVRVAQHDVDGNVHYSKVVKLNKQ